jgi:hypothetical protein
VRGLGSAGDVESSSSLDPKAVLGLLALANDRAKLSALSKQQLEAYECLKRNAYTTLEATGGVVAAVSTEEAVSEAVKHADGNSTEDTNDGKGEDNESEKVDLIVDVEDVTNAQHPSSPLALTAAMTSKGDEHEQELLVFHEDSPMFRCKIADFEANASRLGGYLKVTVFSSHTFHLLTTRSHFDHLEGYHHVHKTYV